MTTFVCSECQGEGELIRPGPVPGDPLIRTPCPCNGDAIFIPEPFKLTPFERVRIGAAVREHVNRMLAAPRYEPLCETDARQRTEFERGSLDTALTVIENIIAEEVEQAS